MTSFQANEQHGNNSTIMKTQYIYMSRRYSFSMYLDVGLIKQKHIKAFVDKLLEYLGLELNDIQLLNSLYFLSTNSLIRVAYVLYNCYCQCIRTHDIFENTLSDQNVSPYLAVNKMKKKYTAKINIIIGDPCVKKSCRYSQQKKMMDWCRSRLHWTINNQWKHIMFNDEMIIVLKSDGELKVWRKATKKQRPECLGYMRECHGSTLKLMVWGLCYLLWYGHLSIYKWKYEL